ncbi:related to ribosomal protein [Cephalotrichum gorgonifer]|uniref:Small ribosomal subunit protein mS29 n=1 Tax=Cephalotrichum gorgonifer TaxID=2041049 RepID=A0AAE8SQJ1_9PEZI|nr:related to ribosomal protein [Cephalotrichum gorgonifer]
MASIALRCLGKARTASIPTTTRLVPGLLPASTVSSAPFSTASILAAAEKGKHNIAGKAKKNYKKKGAGTPTKAKTPGPGERKAFRKRIQLSNNNAIAVTGLGDLTSESLALEESKGTVLGVPDRVVDQLRTVEAFRPTQSWNLFRRPHVLVRSESVELGKMMERAKKERTTLKLVVSGSKVTGKTTMLLQAMAHAFLNKWIVVNIPEAFQLTNGNTDYAPVPDTEPAQFCHPSYTLKLLQSIAKANADVLSALPVTKDYSNISHLAHLGHEPTLADLAGSCRELEFAWPTLVALWSELTTVRGRPPILFALDGLPFIMRNSAYHDTAFNPIHAHDLSTIRLFTDAISGKTAFPNGAAVIASTGGNDNVNIPSLDLVISQLDAGAKGEEIPQPDPYERRYDDRVFDVLKNAQLLKLEGVTKDEARALMEYWAASGVFLDTVTEPAVSTKWTLGGHGILGEMERVTFRNMRC